jgi:hypothetical protein
VITINDKQLLEKITNDKDLETHELHTFLQDIQFNELLRKIEEMEKMLDMENILPQTLRVTPQEFTAACTDPSKRETVLKKIDDGLDYIIPQVTPSFKA